MTNKQLGKYIIPAAVFLVAINSIVTSIQFRTGLPVANTTVWWGLHVLILTIFFLGKKHFVSTKQNDVMKYILFYLMWVVFCIIHGLLIVESYWDWKGLINNSMSLFIPIISYAATNALVFKYILKLYLKIGLGFFVLVAYFIEPVNYGYYLAPISFLLLFLPVIESKHWKIIIVGLTVLVLVANLGARSNVIKFIVPLSLCSLYYMRVLFSTHILNLIRKSFFLLPIILFSLAYTDTFNIFKISDYIQSTHTTLELNGEGDVAEANLKADTRTFIYIENLYSAYKHDYWLIGHSPARGYESMYFGHDDMNGRNERLGSEVSLLNVFTWTGIIGALFYSAIFYRASYLAINVSNNYFSKIIGVFVAFRWAYAWVEDFNNFNLFYFTLWLMIGLCFSISFREMTNAEVKQWVQSIFNNKKLTRKVFKWSR